MMDSQLIGSIGVGLLLLAFVLNLARKLPETNPLYLLMNFIGAFLAAWYAYESGIIPFVVLELVWGISALVRLLYIIKKGPQSD